MTQLAYLDGIDAGYERTFSARVVALPPGAVVLDRTYFYAAGGGQPCDRGSLSVAGGPEIPIVDVAKSGGSVVHRIGRGAPRATGLAVGGEVRGTIDWERRHRHMRLHTAQHLLSALLYERAGVRTVKAVLADRTGTVELEADAPTGEAWEAVAREFRSVLDPPREVRIAFVPRAEWDLAPAARSGLVPLAPTVDPVRVIEIDAIDRCPCGGTHVRSTGEIGGVELPEPVERTARVRLLGGAPPTPSA